MSSLGARCAACGDRVQPLPRKLSRKPRTAEGIRQYMRGKCWLRVDAIHICGGCFWRAMVAQGWVKPKGVCDFDAAQTPEGKRALGEWLDWAIKEWAWCDGRGPDPREYLEDEDEDGDLVAGAERWVWWR